MLTNKKIYFCAILSALLVSGTVMATGTNDLFSVAAAISAQRTAPDQRKSFVAAVAPMPLEKVVALYDILKTMQPNDASTVYGSIFVTASELNGMPKLPNQASLSGGEEVQKFGNDSKTVVIVPPITDNNNRGPNVH
jgi:hypothetical protein